MDDGWVRVSIPFQRDRQSRGNGRSPLRSSPTLIELRRLDLLDSSGKFCGNGANYDAIQAQLAQFRLSYNTVNPNAQADPVVGVVDPAVGIDGPAVNQPCFEGMAVGTRSRRGRSRSRVAPDS